MTRRADFWARRKAAVQAEEAAEAAAVEDRAIEAKHKELESRDDAEILAELDLPDPDTLQIGDDVRGFMAKAVPDRLRRRALRQLWRVNPVLANIDGLVDYGEDFTDATCVIDTLQTSYQVGKGLLAHVEEMARQAEAKAGADDPEPAAETMAETVTPPIPAIATAVEPPAFASQGTALDDAQMTDDGEFTLSPPAPRRMRFDFEG